MQGNFKFMVSTTQYNNSQNKSDSSLHEDDIKFMELKREMTWT